MRVRILNRVRWELRMGAYWLEYLAERLSRYEAKLAGGGRR